MASTDNKRSRTPDTTICHKRGDNYRQDRGKGLRKDKSVRSVVSFYKNAIKRDDIRDIMVDLANR